MKIQDQFINIRDDYEVIHKEKIQVPHAGPRDAYILQENKTGIYHLAYEERTRHMRMISLEQYLKVTDPEQYDETTETECCYCSRYKVYQLKDEQPALDACKQCHRSLKKHFDELLETLDEVDLTARAI